MDCASCGSSNRSGARFCGGCGQALAARCPACANECAPEARFCDACGASLAARPADDGVARKVVTIVFADLIGSTALHERLDAESTRAFMDRYYTAMRDAVEAEGGSVTQLLGDGVKAVFGAPRVAEDDAIRAVRAAVGMQRAFRELALAQSGAVGRVGLRVAVNTGEVVANERTEIIGDPVNVAARLQQEAHDGDVLIGESTRRLVSALVTLASVGSFALKGRSERVSAWRVVSLDRPGTTPAGVFVGRGDELRRIGALHAAAVSAREARLVVVLGSPGLGKSRLIDEFARRQGDGSTLLSLRCDANAGGTFAPLARALRALLELDDGVDSEALRAAVEARLADSPERARIAAGVAALIAGTPTSPEESFFVVRRFLAALAGDGSVVLAIDDLHWAEPLLLDLVEHLVQWSSGVPLFVLAAARPELREVRAALAAPGGVVSEVVTLGGLDADAATRLAANVIGADALPAAVAGRVLATSEGNPLFLGELVRMLVEDGALKREGDRWVAGVELADLEMPPTIHALLAARIERLGPEERTLLERAAIVGRQFSRSAVMELLPKELRGDLDVRLESLRRSELIEPDTGWLLGEPVLRFHHALIRDAAYRRVLKGTRAELHVRFADWMQSRISETAPHDETLGWHLEQAHLLLCELGPQDARGRALGERAAAHLAAAGRRALARDDLALASGLLGRAFERLDADAPARAELALDWCEALLAAGDVGPAARAVDELGRSAGSSKRLRAWHVCFAAQLAALTDPRALRDTAERVAAAAQQLAAENDISGEAKAHSVHAQTLARLGRIGASESALDLALAAARRGGDRRRSNAVLAGAPLAALWGPSPVTRASGRCLDVVRVLRITQGAPAVEAVALRCQAVLEALRGRTDAARRMISASRRLVEELGITQRLLEAELFAGRIELLEGDVLAAERCLRSAYAGLRAQGLDNDAAQAAALLGRALLGQDRVAEAEALSHESESLAGDDRIAGIAWRGLRAEALAKRGEHAAAIEMARAAVEIGSATDALLDHAHARTALATALRAAGRADEAQRETARAIALWEAKGATLLVERASAGEKLGTARATQVVPAPDRRRFVRPNAASFENAASRAVERSRDRWRERDWEGVVACHAESCAMDDRRSIVRLQLPSREFFDNQRILFEIPSIEWSCELLATRGERLALMRVCFEGKALGSGHLALDHLSVAEVDSAERVSALVLFDPEGHDLAYAELDARFAATAGPPYARLRSFREAQTARDWDAVREQCAPDFVMHDHRRVGWENLHGGESWVQMLRVLVDLAPDVRQRVDHFRLSERGSLMQMTWMGTREGGVFEDSKIVVSEWDATGLFRRMDQYDADQLGMAQSRFADQQQRPERVASLTRAFSEAFAVRDWNALAALLAPDLVVSDHRRLGWETLRGADAYIQALRSLVELAPDVRLRVDHVERAEPGYLYFTSWQGTREGGAFEEPSWIVCELDSAGRIRRFDQYDLEQQGEAKAQLAAIGAAGAHDPLRIPPNAATRAMDGHQRALFTSSWGDLAERLVPGMLFDDRRRGVLVRGDREQFIAGCRLIASARGSLVRTLLATAGDRLALELAHWSGSTADVAAYEAENLSLVEVDASGRIVAIVSFDPHERRAANVEMRERFALSEEARLVPPAVFAASRAMNARDFDALRATLHPEYVYDDHRRSGPGRLEGADAYVAWIESLFAVSPDASIASLYYVAIAPHGTLSVAQTSGTQSDGGDFVSAFVQVGLFRDGRLAVTELFELDDFEAARACFEAAARWYRRALQEERA